MSGLIILGVILITCGGIFLIAALWFKRSIAANEDKWVNTTGTIMMYNTEDYSSRVRPVVQFMENGKEILATAASIAQKDCPKPGTVIPIEYRRNDFPNGNVTYQVFLTGDQAKSFDDTILIPVILILGVGLMVGGAVVLFL